MIPIARAVAMDSVVRCAPVSTVAVILRLSSRTGKKDMAVTADRPILISASLLPIPACMSPFSYSDNQTVRQVEIDIEFAKHIGSEDAVNRR